MTNTEIANASKIMLGSTEAVKMYIGSTLVWEALTTLPYDAEIEYLESTGTLYIDLNIIPDENTGIYVKSIDNNQSGTFDHYTAGLRDNSGNTRWCIGHDNSKWYFGYGAKTNICSSYSAYIAEVTLNYLNSKTATCVVNDNTYTLNLSSLTFTPQNNIRVFGSSGLSAYYTVWDGKIYEFKVSQGSNCIVDLIPVRVGQTGYMYDKVSGQLFGNSGTGDFVLGPDKQ